MAHKVKPPHERKYSDETLRKIADAVKQGLAECSSEDLAEIHVSLSEGNSKIGRTLNVSTPPVIGCCGNCVVCKNECYANGGFLQQGYDWKKNAWIKNQILKVRDMMRYFAEIRASIDDAEYFRWHVSGDVQKAEEVPQMATIARMNPGCRFLVFTKNYEAFNKYFEAIGGYDHRPQNFQVLYSVWVGLDCPNPFGVPECHINRADGRQTYEHIAENLRHHCNGDCEFCEKNGVGCFWLKRGEATIINQH